MTEYQHYAILKSGDLCYAGALRHRTMNDRVAKSIHRNWLRWATRYVAENEGDYPLATHVRQMPVNPVVEMRVHPVGKNDQCVSYTI